MLSTRHPGLVIFVGLLVHIRIFVRRYRDGDKFFEKYPLRLLGAAVKIDFKTVTCVSLNMVIIAVPPHSPFGFADSRGHGMVMPTGQDVSDVIGAALPDEANRALDFALSLHINHFANKFHDRFLNGVSVGLLVF